MSNREVLAAIDKRIRDALAEAQLLVEGYVVSIAEGAGRIQITGGRFQTVIIPKDIRLEPGDYVIALRSRRFGKWVVAASLRDQRGIGSVQQPNIHQQANVAPPTAVTLRSIGNTAIVTWTVPESGLLYELEINDQPFNAGADAIFTTGASYAWDGTIGDEVYARVRCSRQQGYWSGWSVWASGVLTPGQVVYAGPEEPANASIYEMWYDTSEHSLKIGLGSATATSVETGEASAWVDVVDASSVGGGSSSLLVEEIDGTPSVEYVDTIKISNGALTDLGDGAVQIDLAGSSTPGLARVWPHDFVTLTGTWITAVVVTQPYNCMVYNSTSDDGDSADAQFFAQAGTYTLYVLGQTETNRGKADWYIDGSLVVSGQDWYAGTPANNVTKSSAGITIASSGMHTLKLVVNGKNASSGDYYIGLNLVRLLRTGA